MRDMKKIEAVFYQNAGGNEPVREWLLGLDREDRKSDFYREARVYGAASRLYKENAKARSEAAQSFTFRSSKLP